MEMDNSCLIGVFTIFQKKRWNALYLSFKPSYTYIRTRYFIVLEICWESGNVTEPEDDRTYIYTGMPSSCSLKNLVFQGMQYLRHLLPISISTIIQLAWLYDSYPHTHTHNYIHTCTHTDRTNFFWVVIMIYMIIVCCTHNYFILCQTVWRIKILISQSYILKNIINYCGLHVFILFT